MTTARALYHLARADFLERVRRYSFLISLALTTYFCYVCLPPNHASYVTLRIAATAAFTIPRTSALWWRC